MRIKRLLARQAETIKIVTLLITSMVIEVPFLYFFSAMILPSGLAMIAFFFHDHRNDLLYPMIITTIVGVVSLVAAVWKHIREGL